MTLKKIIEAYGKDKINTFTKYPSILTLHELGEKGRLIDQLTTKIDFEEKFGFFEKIDGTNVRIIFYGGEYLIGSRKEILYYSNDLYWDNSMGIVHLMKEMFNLDMIAQELNKDVMVTVYGELYGGKITVKSKNYGKDAHGFRIFDVVQTIDFSILKEPIEKISSWREHKTENGLVYGQDFANQNHFEYYQKYFEIVPKLNFDLDKNDLSHQTILDNLSTALPKTKVQLTDSGLGNAEGIIMRNHDRSVILKLRFEDYERTLRNRK